MVLQEDAVQGESLLEGDVINSSDASAVIKVKYLDQEDTSTYAGEFIDFIPWR